MQFAYVTKVVLAKTIKHLLDGHWTETGHGHCQKLLAY